MVDRRSYTARTWYSVTPTPRLSCAVACMTSLHCPQGRLWLVTIYGTGQRDDWGMLQGCRSQYGASSTTDGAFLAISFTGSFTSLQASASPCPVFYNQYVDPLSTGKPLVVDFSGLVGAWVQIRPHTDRQALVWATNLTTTCRCQWGRTDTLFPGWLTQSAQSLSKPRIWMLGFSLSWCIGGLGEGRWDGWPQVEKTWLVS